jgi:diaminopropionate ammonia-lyase
VLVRALVNTAADPSAVPLPSRDAADFHASMPDYRPTPVRDLRSLAAELGLGSVGLKDESLRLGLPAFKVLGASWAIERALRERPDVHTLVAASAGNHGRAVANVAARRGLKARVYLSDRSAPARREAIAGEGAEVVLVDGSYEDACALAATVAGQDGMLEVADVGDSGPASWVIDGYATLFAEAGPGWDLVMVPVGVGSLAAAAARYGAEAGARVIGVEAATAPCLTASLAAGEPTVVPTPGTTMAGLDCAEVSVAAWPVLRCGIHGTVTVPDPEVHAAMRELADLGFTIGDSGAAPLAALRALACDAAATELRDAVGLGPDTRVLLIATEGATDPAGYADVIGRP